MMNNTRDQRLTQAESLAAFVGNTPLLPLRNMTRSLPASVSIYAKAEWFNLGGSTKDRAALMIIQNALREGKLPPGKRLLDSSSGNTGIAYATFGAALNIPVTLVLSENASEERKTTLRSLGVELILSDASTGSDGAREVVKEVYAQNPERYFYANQYSNPASWLSHYEGTGPEIYAQTEGKVTHFVGVMGTSGVMMGVGRYLHEQNPNIETVAVFPAAPKHGLAGMKHMDTAEHPKIYDPSVHDRKLAIETEEAFEMTRRLAKEEGIFVGPSSGAAALAAIRVAQELEEGVVVTLFSDAGYKYLSMSELWG